MRKLILEHLRGFSEGRNTPHTSSNPSFGGKVFFYTANDIRAEIAKANVIYKENSAELGSVNEGDGLYEFILYPSGKGKFGFGGKMNSIGSKREPGDTNKSKGGGVLYMYIKANKGIIHPEYELDSDAQESKSHSPMSHAKIKTLFFLGPEIMNFIDGSLDIHKEKSPEEKAKEMAAYKDETPEGLRYKYDKLAKEKEFAKNKSQITMDSDEAEIRNQLMDVVKAKVDARKSGDKETAKKLANIEKQLRAKLK